MVHKLSIGCWNIRRGLFTREIELRSFLKKEHIDIMFLVETDIILNGKDDFKIEEYQTVTTKHDATGEKIRVIGLIEEEVAISAKTREDLMSTEFPSIWLEITREHQKNVLVCGVYREWNRDGLKTEKDQKHRLKILTSQLEKATEENKIIIMIGDANLCSQKWENKEYNHFDMASELRGTLAQCGMEIMDLGKTFMADKTRTDGTLIESAIDHI
jgi:exonuclease III